MDNLQNLTELVREIGSSDGPTAVFAAGKLGKIGMGAAIASVVIGLLFCFLGWAALSAARQILQDLQESLSFLQQRFFWGR